MRYRMKRLLAELLSAVILLSLLPATALAAGDFTGADSGDGSSGAPYQISTAEQLRQLSEYVNGGKDCTGLFFKLTADIDLGGEGNQWTPIGNTNNRFNGSFDGGNHTVCVYIDSPVGTIKDLGFFGYIDTNGAVKNLGVSGSIDGSGIGDSYVGGIAGQNYGTIENCYNTATVTGPNTVGGIVGNTSGSLQNCYNTGAVSSGWYAGGVVGEIRNGQVQNCYNTGTVSGNAAGGGIVGNILEGNCVNCYNTGHVEGTPYQTGGLAGSGNAGRFTNCYYLDSTAEHGVPPVGTNDESEKKTAGEFRSLASLLNNGGDAWEDDSFLGRPVLKANKEPWPISGSGTESDPYLIPDKETLEKVRNYINSSSDGGEGKTFKLTADIDLGGDADHPWTPIGWSERSDKHFNGTFDGGTFTVRGLYVNTNYYGGLFGYIGESGTVKYLTVEGEVRGNANTGGIAGQCDGRMEKCVNAATVTGNMLAGGIAGNVGGGASIQECVNTGKVTGNSTFIGGIVGQISGGVTISGCQNSGEVSGKTANVGGIAGGVQSIPTAATVENCRNTRKVTGEGTNIGGIVGMNDANCTVVDCSNYGIVSGQQNTGGVVGLNNDGTVKNCYNTGKIAGTVFNIGGVVGSNAKGTVENCYNAGPVTGEGEVGIIGGVAGSNHSAIKNCYNTGEVKGTQNTGGVVGTQSDGSCVNSYYLDTCGADGDAGTKKTAGEFRFLASALGEGWADSVAGRPVLLSNQETDIIDADTPYEIPDLDTMKAFRNYINSSSDGGKDKVFRLTKSIDLESEEWTPIGSSGSPFQGTFDGGNFTIRGLSIDQPSSSGVGLFGYLKEGGTVKNLTVEGNVTGSSYVGGIVGQSMGGNIENCHNAAAVTGTNDSIGGVVGFSNGGTVTNCYNTATVTGGVQYIGGIVGYDVRGTMTNCYNTATVTGHYLVGGIAGENQSSMVTNCYYLDTTQADRKATPKTAEQFASGEVAYLLQSGQAAQEPLTWGQTVGGDCPELTGSPEKKVFKITGKVEDQADVVWYSNSSASLPAAEPTKEGYTFAGWSKTDGGSVDFTAGTPVSEDMTVYAVFVNKRVDGTGTLTMKDYTCGDTSVTPEAKSDTNTGAVTITYKQKGADDNTYTSDKPTTAGEYTVKAVFPANQNYNELTLTADFKITHQFNAGWEHREDGEYHRCACGTGLLLETKELSEVPEGLKQNPDVDTVEEIEQVLVEKVATGDHYVIYDVELEALIGGTWQIVTPESLPDEGVAITIPYPDGTSAKYPFTVVHMFTTAGDGHAPGDTEILKATNEADGIHFTVKSFSPIIIGWKTGNLTVTVTDTGEGAGPAQQWQFRVELDDKTVTGTFGEMEFTAGVAEFTLQSGQSLTARDLPEGVKYTVTELEADQNGYTTTYTDDRGIITSEQDMIAAFINDKPAQAKPDKPSDDPDTPTVNPPDTPTDNPPDTPTSNNPNDTPKTGDESHLALWFSLIIVSLLGITVIILTPIIGRKKPVSAHGKHMRK